MSNNNLSQDWKLFEECKGYLSRQDPNYFNVVNTNIDFIFGKQWKNLQGVDNLPKPVFNILARILDYFVAFLVSMSKKIVITKSDIYSDDNVPEDEITPIDVANAEINNILNADNLKATRQKILSDAGTTGDGYIHYKWNKTKKPFGGAYASIQGAIDYEFVSSTNVFFVNANNPNKEVQPAIIVVGRDTIKNLQEEAKTNETIIRDDDKDTVAGNKLEVELDDNGKAQYIIVYKRHKDGLIYASKSVKNTYIYEDAPTGLKYFPIAKMTWKEQPNQYFGNALITGMIPNQIYINQMFAMIQYHERRRAFPTVIFNKDKIDNYNPSLGAMVAVQNLDSNVSVRNIVDYVSPEDISNQITNTIELTMQYSKECLGISDATLGNIDPKNTSAIVAVQKSSTVPLENISTNEDVFLKQVAHILLDFMSVYYGPRPICVEKNGEKQVVIFDFRQLKDLDLNTNIEVSDSTYFSEPKQIQTLDNLLNIKAINTTQYLERIPNDYIKDRQKLIDEIKQDAQAQLNNNNAKYEQMTQFVNALPKEIQDKLKALPDEQFEAEVMKLMQAQGEQIA